MRISNQVATLDEAKAEFEASWKQWKAWAGLEKPQIRRGRLARSRLYHTHFSPATRGAFSLRVPPTLCAGLLKSSHCRRA